MCIVFICKCQRIMTSDNDKIIMRRSAKHWYSVVVIGPMCNRFSANIIKKKNVFPLRFRSDHLYSWKHKRIFLYILTTPSAFSCFFLFFLCAFISDRGRTVW